MMTSKELKEHKNKYLSLFENKREVIISMPIDTLIKLIENQEKLTQAIDILKKKNVDLIELCFSYSLNEYNIMARNSDFDELTQEEYSLLREVFKNE